MLAYVTAERRSPGVSRDDARLQKLNRVLRHVWEHNPFYRDKWRSAGLRPHEFPSLEALCEFPFTTRAELLADQLKNPPLGSNLSCPFSDIKRVHRSSGTTLAPLSWGDTQQSWEWVMRGSQALLKLAGVTTNDRLLCILPFGGSSGPWIIYEGALRLGCCCFAVAPEDTAGQLRALRFRPTVLVGKPAWLAFVECIDQFPEIKKLIVTGGTCRFPGGLESFVRYGLTEAGSVAGECSAHCGLHLLEDNFIAEVVDPESGVRVPDGTSGELVLTTLGRLAQPIIRYRTGDAVRRVHDDHCACGRSGARLIGSIERLSR